MMIIRPSCYCCDTLILGVQVKILLNEDQNVAPCFEGLEDQGLFREITHLEYHIDL